MTTVVVPSQFDKDAHQYKCCCDKCHVRTGTLVLASLESIGLLLRFVSEICLVAYIGSSYVGQFGGSLVGILISALILGLLFYGIKHESASYLIPHMILQGKLFKRHHKKVRLSKFRLLGRQQDTLILGIIAAMIAIIIVVAVLAGAAGSLSAIIPQLTNVTTSTATDATQNLQLNSVTGLANDKTDQVSNTIAAVTSVTIAIGVAIILVCVLSVGLQVWFFLIVLACYRYLRDLRLYGVTHNGVATTYGTQGAPPAAYPGAAAQPGYYK